MKRTWVVIEFEDASSPGLEAEIDAFVLDLVAV